MGDETLTQLRQCRELRGWTQQELADALARTAWDLYQQRVGINADMVSKWERGIKVPSALYRRVLHRTLPGVSPSSIGGVAQSYGRPDVPTLDHEPISDVAARSLWLTSTQTSSEYLDAVEGLISAVVDSYEKQGPRALIGTVVQRRRDVELHLRRPQPIKQVSRLFTLAGQLSGLLAYMSVNLGRFHLADAYCDEAFALAQHAEDRELQAWSRGTASLSSYYAGDFAMALATARDGLRYAAGGAQAIRLAINGEARALARLGNNAGAKRAVDLAYLVASRNDTPAGVTSCISFGPYGSARTAANAATVYVDLSDHEMVEHHARLALPECEASESVWSQSLVRLDVARSLMKGKRPEVEQAAALASEALTISSERPITSVLQRSRDVMAAATPFAPLPELDHLAATLALASTRT